MNSQHLNSRADEFDLVELLRVLWRQKYLIVGVTFIVAFIAAGYAFLATPYYQTKTYLRPIPQSSLDQLNETGIYTLSPEDAINRVAAGLSSYDNRRDFFLKNRELFQGVVEDSNSPERAFAEFSDQAFEMLFPDPKRTDNRSAFVGLKLTYPKGMDGAAVVNDFVAYVLELQRREIAEDIESLIKNRLASLDMNINAQRANYSASKEAKIAELREDAALKRALLHDELAALRDELKTRRMNRIQQLSEAISIAESLGIRMPTSPSGMADSSAGTQVIRTEVTNRDTPLYFLGTEALAAERDALADRKSDDFVEPRIAQIQSELRMLENNREVEILEARKGKDLYLNNLASLREEGARLNGIKLDVERLRLVRVDQLALDTSQPIRPKRLMIIALGLVLGTMLGMFVALVHSLMACNAPSLTHSSIRFTAPGGEKQS